MDWRKLERDLIDIRRDLHRYPEAAWTEFRTSSLIAERLERLGGSRGLNIYGNYDSGVFPRYGIFRRAHGGFHLKVGGGVA